MLRRAKELDDYLLVGVTSDSFDRRRGKLNVRNNVLERVEAVKTTRYADEVMIEDYLGQKIDDIQKCLELKNALFIPKYDEVFRDVLKRYHDDFRQEGIHSYDYKMKSKRQR